MNLPPKIELKTLDLSNNYYADNDGNQWNVSGLIQYCKEQGYEEFDLPLAGIDLGFLPWDFRTLYDLLNHCNRINNADLQYPIIIREHGGICDGFHRIAKAILNGERTIKAIRMQSMPAPDSMATD